MKDNPLRCTVTHRCHAEYSALNTRYFQCSLSLFMLACNICGNEWQYNLGVSKCRTSRRTPPFSSPLSEVVKNPAGFRVGYCHMRVWLCCNWGYVNLFIFVWLHATCHFYFGFADLFIKLLNILFGCIKKLTIFYTVATCCSRA